MNKRREERATRLGVSRACKERMALHVIGNHPRGVHRAIAMPRNPPLSFATLDTKRLLLRLARHRAAVE